MVIFRSDGQFNDGPLQLHPTVPVDMPAGGGQIIEPPAPQRPAVVVEPYRGSWVGTDSLVDAENGSPRRKPALPLDVGPLHPPADSPDPAPAAPAPAAPDADSWTLGGVTMKRLHWYLAAALAVAFLFAFLKFMTK